MTPQRNLKPYLEAADVYIEAGWTQPLPLPPGKKGPPPKGYTGREGQAPSPADIQTWKEFKPSSNIALRMPLDVIGLDVDAYNGKNGAATLQDLERRLGPLPTTFRSTSRDDGVSGIRFFRVPVKPSWRDAGTGIETIWHGHRYSVVSPSTNFDNAGRRYFWFDESSGQPVQTIPRNQSLPYLPGTWVDHLSEIHQRSPKAEVGDSEFELWLRGLDDEDLSPAVQDELARFRTELRDGGSRHTTARDSTLRMMRLGKMGESGVPEALEEMEAAFSAAVCNGPNSRSQKEAQSEWRRLLIGAFQIVVAQSATAADRPLPATAAPRGAMPSGDCSVEEALAAARQILHLDDDVALLVLCAAAATVDLDGEPAWVMMVGPPSSGKSHILSLLKGVVDHYVDDTTPAGWLSWDRKGKRPVGVLVRSPMKSLFAISDFSTVLADSDRGRRDKEYAIIRNIYDGRLSRDLGNSPEPLIWKGRITLLAGATPRIDRFTSYEDALGPRWLFVRNRPKPTEEALAAAQAVRVRDGDTRAELQAKAEQILENLIRSSRPKAAGVELSQLLRTAIDRAAMGCALGRTSVPRDGYGRREIIDAPVAEEPHRLIGQLTNLARGALALGLSEAEVIGLCRRVAGDTMPAKRAGVLRALSSAGGLSSTQAVRESGLSRGLIIKVLEELQVAGVVRRVAGTEASGGTDPWALVEGLNGDLVRELFAPGGCHEMLVTTPPPPSNGEAARPGHPTDRDTPRGLQRPQFHGRRRLVRGEPLI
jgi:hypothetical protein